MSLTEAENKAGYSRNILRPPSEFLQRLQKTSLIFENTQTVGNTNIF